MARFLAVLLGLLVVSAIPVAGLAQGRVSREVEMAHAVRAILARSRDPQEVAPLLRRHGARFLGFQEAQVTFAFQEGRVVPTRSVTRSVGRGLGESVAATGLSDSVRPMAGEKTDLTLTMWLYEWRNRDGTYTEQVVVSGYWSDTEYRWLDDPDDVIDVRWIVGDLVYTSSTPFDGVRRDQHTNGIASFTVQDQVKSWDLFVNFKPVSPGVYGKWTNVFANYTHTWFGVKLSVTLGAAPNGATGSIQIHTDGKTWTEGTGLAFQIGSEQTRGPATTGVAAPAGSE